jgi:hypothetical protein
MKPNHTSAKLFQLKLLSYAERHYIDCVKRLECVLATRPAALRLELIGMGEIPADSALLLRSVLLARAPGTYLVTQARSSLQNGAVLVWLLGETRLIRDDARLYFRRAVLDESDESKSEEEWKAEPDHWGCPSESMPEEGDHAAVLRCIGEYLPVNELAGRLIDVPALRQLGLVDNERMDRFLVSAFSRDSKSAPQARGIAGAGADSVSESRVEQSGE